MAKKIGNQTYPDKIGAIRKDEDLLDIVENWAHARQPLAENLLMFLQTNMPTDRIYEHFLKTGAAHTLDLRLNDKLVDAMDKLADAEDWKHPIWKTAIRSMRADCEKTLDARYLPKFWDSKEFMDYHGTVAAKDIGSTAKVAKILGISDEPALRNLMIATNMGSQRDIKKYSDELIKKQKIKEASGTFLGRLKKAMGV